MLWAALDPCGPIEEWFGGGRGQAKHAAGIKLNTKALREASRRREGRACAQAVAKLADDIGALTGSGASVAQVVVC